MEKKKRNKQLYVKVYLSPGELDIIKENALLSKLSVSSYMRKVSLNLKISTAIDLAKFNELVKINADIARLGNLIKLWLSNDRRVSHFGTGHINAVFNNINEASNDLKKTMRLVIHKKH
jgi:hypothetical protein